MQLKVSLAQIHIALGDETANRDNMAHHVRLASQLQSDVVIFPELWSTGYVLDQAKDIAFPLGEGVYTFIADLAIEHQITIIGSTLEQTPDGVANCATVFNPQGKLLGRYQKTHLFGLMDEDKWLVAGNEPLCLDLPWGKTGIAICYDLRFPELFRHYSVREDAKVMILPAEWPLRRVEHWRALLIARAIENQAYVIGVNTAGEIDGVPFGGHSMVVDPWGRIIVEAGETPQFLTAQINLSVVDQARATIPVFADRRDDVYG